MINKIISIIYFLIIFITPDYSFSQQTHNEKLNNKQERYLIKSNKIKTKTITLFDRKNPAQIPDNGFKTSSFIYDIDGKLIELTNYHPYKELTQKFQYFYNIKGDVQLIKKFNSNNDVIETMEYKYRKNSGVSSVEVIQYYNPPVYLYYTVNVNIADAVVFSELQDVMQIEPKLESYSLTINLSDPDVENQYIVIGDENSVNPMIFPWTMLSAYLQSELLSWDISPKTVHNINKLNPAYITFKYKKDRVLKTIIATNGKIIKKEIYKTNEDMNVTSYMKYNTNGKLINNEAYAYDPLKKVIIEIVDLNTRVKEIIKYDDYNYITQREYYSSAGNLTSKVIYNYSENKLLQEIFYDNKTEIEKVVKYEYDVATYLLNTKSEYDSQDNIIKQFRYDYTFY